MKKVLFICSQNRFRSLTAETVFAEDSNLEVKSAGLDNDARVRVTPELVEWAEIIFVMEKNHRNRLQKKFKKYLNKQRVICLGVPDDYEYMDPYLVEIFKNRIPKILGLQ